MPMRLRTFIKPLTKGHIMKKLLVNALLVYLHWL